MVQPALARVAGGYFTTVLLTAAAPEAETAAPAALRSQLIGQLDRLARHPRAQALDAQEFEDVRFALVAWADEVLLQSTWSGRDEWAQELLQLRLFRTNRGGDEFYDRLARLRPDQSEVRLIFLLCLAFGFAGQLIDQEANRAALMQRHYDMLRAAGAARDVIGSGPLSPEAYQLEVQLDPPASGSTARILLVAGVVAAAIYTILWGVLSLLASRVPLPPGV